MFVGAFGWYFVIFRIGAGRWPVGGHVGVGLFRWLLGGAVHVVAGFCRCLVCRR